MRFIYCDSGLSSNLGHHANSCRAILREVRKRGIDAYAFTHKNCQSDIIAELEAWPHFRVHTYESSPEPISGWLNHFLAAAEITKLDLVNLTNKEWRADDVCYFNSAQAAQLYAVIQWMAERSYANLPLPSVTVELGVDPGVDVTWKGERMELSIRDPRIDSRGTLYHFTGSQIPDNILPKLTIATYDKWSSMAYEGILRKPVVTLPVPKDGRIIDRTKRDTVTVAMLGHQRLEKGWGMVTQIVREVINTCPENVRFLAHNGAPELFPDIQDTLKHMYSYGRLTVDERTANDKVWQELLDASDIVLLPYDPQRFAISYSAIADECECNGIPMIVPEGTTMARMVTESGAGVVYHSERIADIPNIVKAMAEDYGRHLEPAVKAAQKWRETQGVARTVDALLGA